MSASAPLTPLELIQKQPEVYRLTLPVGAIDFSSGELSFYEDLVGGTECHSRDATAVTPVSLFRLSRSNFLALIHRHQTLVLQLLSKQHSRLRQQRADARHFY